MPTGPSHLIDICLRSGATCTEVMLADSAAQAGPQLAIRSKHASNGAPYRDNGNFISTLSSGMSTDRCGHSKLDELMPCLWAFLRCIGRGNPHRDLTTVEMVVSKENVFISCYMDLLNQRLF